MHHARITLAAVLLSMGWPPPSVVQSSTTARPFYSRSLGPVGIYAPGKWGVIAVDVCNPTGEAVDLLANVYLADDLSRQYGRQLWVPPNAKRSSWFPLRLPSSIPKNQQHVEVRSLLFDRSSGEETALRSPNGAHAQAGTLAIERDRPVTGIIVDEADKDVRRAALAMRQSQNRSQRIVFLDVVALPPLSRILEEFDQLVLSSNQIAESAALADVRSWLHGGGRLWIMLDQVDPATVAILLGEDFEVHVVDRVDLTDLRIAAAARRPHNPGGPHRHFSEPVQLVRVLTESSDVDYLVNNWPVAFWQRIGRGEVLLTTLEDRAWLDVDLKSNLPSSGAATTAVELATDPLSTLAHRFLQRQTPPALPPSELREFVQDQIGYEIVARSTAAGWLGGFCLGVLIVGIWFARIKRQEYLAVWVVVGSAGVALSLLLTGRAARQQVPSTVAIGQFVHAVPDAEQVTIAGQVCLYRSEPLRDRLVASNGAFFQLETSAASSPLHRLVWSDFDRYRWENLNLRPGIHFASYSRRQRVARPLSARATFTAEGLTGVIQSAPWENLSDALIATPEGKNLAVRMGEKGHFRVAAGDPLPPNQFFIDAVLTDEQRRRAKVISQLLMNSGSSSFPGVPTLLAWAPATAVPLSLSAVTPIQGATLLAIPLGMDRPEADTKIVIPAPLLPYQSVALPSGAPASTAYDNAQRKWIGPLTQASKIALRFQIPREIRPFRLEEAELKIKVHAPGRQLKIAATGPAEEVIIASFDSSTGRLQRRIDQPQLLQGEDRGDLSLIVIVGHRTDEQLGSIAEVGWQIDDLSLHVSGVALTP